MEKIEEVRLEMKVKQTSRFFSPEPKREAPFKYKTSNEMFFENV